MKQVKHIVVREVAGTEVLAGASAGAAALSRFVAGTAGSGADRVVLDFQEISIATVSWLREAVFGFQRFCRSREHALLLLVANASDQVLEELGVAAEALRELVVVGDFKDGEVQRPRVVGPLDPVQGYTLALVCELEEVDAPQLQARLPNVALSALNNRLAVLRERGLLLSTRQGRTRRYRLAFEGLRPWD